MGKKAYNERTDLEKIQSQWHKLTGLHVREESSAAVVRAATAAELAANYAIRREFAKQSTVRAEFVDDLLKWANGLQGKMQRLLLPITKGRGRFEKLNDFQKIAQTLNATRNGIVHQGEFCGVKKAEATIKDARTLIEGLVQHYEPDFELVDQD